MATALAIGRMPFRSIRPSKRISMATGLAIVADEDDDGDLIPDTLDAHDRGTRRPRLDADGDGFGDNVDAFPTDPTEHSDYDGDGLGDEIDDDDDNDGVVDLLDDFPNDPAESTDSDFDGLGDNQDGLPFNAADKRDTDGDGIGDSLDDDDDGDGIKDEFDAFPQDKAESGGYRRRWHRRSRRPRMMTTTASMDDPR